MTCRIALLFVLGLVVTGLPLASPLSAETLTLNTGARGLPGDGERRIDVCLTPGITRSDQLPPHLARARKALTRKQNLKSSTLRAMADLGDGYAAFHLAKRLDLEAHPEQAADAAHYFGIAAATGRGGAIYGMIRALDLTNPETTSQARLDVLRNVLTAYAQAGSPPALDALMRYHQSARPFGSMRVEFEALAQQDGRPGAPAVALQLASDLLQSPTATRTELEQARDYLQIATSADSLRRSLVAANLLPKVEARLAALPPSDMPVDAAAPDDPDPAAMTEATQ